MGTRRAKDVRCSSLKSSDLLQSHFLGCANETTLFASETESPANGNLTGRAANRLRSGSNIRLLFGPFQEPVETGASNAEQLCGADAVAFTRVENTPDVLPADFFEGQRPPGVLRMTVATRRLLKVFGEVIHVDEVIYRSKARAGNHVFQLANVAGPRVLEQDGLRSPRQPLDLLAIGLVVFFEKMLNEQGNVIQTLTQAGNANLNRAEAVEEILTEAAGKHFRAQIPVGRGNQADIHLADLGRTYALNFPILNHAQQLCLHSQRGFSFFVEENGPAIGVFEQAGARIGR